MKDLTALQLAQQIKEKKISVIDAAADCIAKAKENKNNAFVYVDEAYALERAKKVQADIDSGKAVSPLAGVPIAVKDNISVKGMQTTCCSKMLADYHPVYSATVIEKLEQAGLVIVGKLNMDEFAMGGSSETGYFGAVRNPWDETRVTGGSSGGSAAAIVSGEVLLALGSDSGGSIRQPCSFCGATGIKPTYGAVSRYGTVAYASSHDQVGPMAGNIDDCAALLSVISGPDEKDSTCIIEAPFETDDITGTGGSSEANCQSQSQNQNQNKIQNQNQTGKPFVIGLPRNYLGDALEGEIKDAILAAAEVFKSTGAIIEDIEVPYMDYVVPTYYIIACAEASSNMSRYDGLKYGHRSEEARELQEVYRRSRSEGFGLEVKRRIMLGSFVLSSGYYDAYYKKALQVRTLIKNAYNDLFKRCDMILSPVAPTTAFKIGENINDPLKMYMADVYTASVNLAGIPAAAIPCGFDSSGMPIGLQLIGDTFSEIKLIKAARTYQTKTDYHKARPSV